MGTLAAIGNILICFGIPLGALAYYLARDKRCAIAFGLGVIGFLVSQVLIRLPLLSMLGQTAWFTVFAATQPLVYALALAASAGLFEETARFLLLRTQRKAPFDLKIPLAYGLGHGGLEAALIGLNSVALLALPDQLAMAGPAIILAGIERIGAIMVQVALSVIVYVAVKRRSVVPFLAALFFHTLVDLGALSASMPSVSPWAFEAVFLLVAILFLLVTVRWAQSRRTDV
ncbi:YhfC family glutamic-type intramembrane protease [Raoultibacter phocaeensis]|uniref:YhfC family glutamic-type intramembrane protease n=1 Tax=Raoultibacter phocaeensis TaxID=2479841 RepID=UPI00111A45B6|nr:YhfC family glutamic-type intramembrane protease [Raoultibacter phocaeensis]